MKKLTVLASALSVTLLGLALVGCEAKNPATTNTTPATKTEAEYVAQGAKLAMTCAHCHWTHTNGAPDPTKMWQGGNGLLMGPLGIAVTANITPYDGSKIKELSAPELVDYWKKEYTGGLLMPKVFEHMAEDDLLSIAYYLKTVPAALDHGKTSFAFAGKAGATDWPSPNGSGWTTNEVPGGWEVNLMGPGSADGITKAGVEALIQMANPTQ